MIRYVAYIFVIAALAFIVMANGQNKNPGVTAVNLGIMSTGVFLIGESFSKIPCGPPNLSYYK